MPIHDLPTVKVATIPLTRSQMTLGSILNPTLLSWRYYKEYADFCHVPLCFRSITGKCF